MRQILEEGIERPFALQGVYHNSPMLNSIYQAYVSWVFGGGAWGWKFSSVLGVAIAVPGIYILGYIFAGRIAGIVSAVILLSSHYVMAFTHIGYTHLDALPVTVWAMLAFIVGSRRKSAPIPVCCRSFGRSWPIHRLAGPCRISALLRLAPVQPRIPATVVCVSANGTRIWDMRAAVPIGERS